MERPFRQAMFVLATTQTSGFAGENVRLTLSSRSACDVRVVTVRTPRRSTWTTWSPVPSGYAVVSEAVKPSVPQSGVTASPGSPTADTTVLVSLPRASMKCIVVR